MSQQHFTCIGPDGGTIEIGPRDFFVVIRRAYVSGERTALDVQEACSQGFLTWGQVVEILGMEQAYNTASGRREVA